MSKSIFKRISRIISGNANALVDIIENANTDAVFEETIREIDSAIDELKTELGQVLAAKFLANKKLIEINNKYEDLNEKIEVAIKEKRDDLAKVAISQQFDFEAQIPIVESTLADCDQEKIEYENYIKALEAKKREMKQEYQALKEAKKEAEKRAGVKDDDLEPIRHGDSHPGKSVKEKVSSSTNAFDHLYEKQSHLKNTRNPFNLEHEQKLKELEEMQKENRIEERLASYKSKK